MPGRALQLATIAILLEVVLVLPWVDRLADESSTAHFTQHGLIFLGGILMGWAIRELRRP